MTKTTLDATILAQFTGTERWYRHGLVKTLTFTDGVKYVADTAGAYWLVDELALAQLYIPEVRKESFQVWKLVLAGNGPATLICEDGDYKEVWRKAIEYTDFPEPEITLWLTDNVIMLPSEY